MFTHPQPTPHSHASFTPLQKFEATPSSEVANLVRGYDALCRFGGPPRQLADRPADHVTSGNAAGSGDTGYEGTRGDTVAAAVGDATGAAAVSDATGAIAAGGATGAAAAGDATGEEQRRFDAWASGRTGHPPVD